MTMKKDVEIEEELTMSVQNWHEEFDEFWHKHSKISKIYTLTLFRMGGGKAPATRFSSVTSANVRISPPNFLTFSFNPFVTLV